MNIHVVAVLVSVAIFLFVIELVRRRRLTFKYAVGWLLVSAGAIFLRYFTICFLLARHCSALSCPAILFSSRCFACLCS